MLALVRDFEAGPLKGANGIEMVDTGHLGHSQTATSISRTSLGSICWSMTDR